MKAESFSGLPLYSRVNIPDSPDNILAFGLHIPAIFNANWKERKQILESIKHITAGIHTSKMSNQNMKRKLHVSDLIARLVCFPLY